MGKIIHVHIGPALIMAVGLVMFGAGLGLLYGTCRCQRLLFKDAHYVMEVP